MKNRSYNELIQLETFKERIEYLKLDGQVGEATFGNERYLNQRFYKSEQWLKTRSQIIIRDEGCDLGIEDRSINCVLMVHHINPITIEDIINDDPCLYDHNNLICTKKSTHDYIHYGVGKYVPTFVERKPNDQTPWR